MSQTSISKRKSFWGFFSPFLDLIFPPLCLNCKEYTREKFFCLNCWESCALPDPTEHCRYCFEPLNSRIDICIQCRNSRKLPLVRGFVFDKDSPAHLMGTQKPETLAAFAFIQWARLNWHQPDAIIPMPGAIRIAQELSKYIDAPFIPALNRYSEYREDRLEEDQTLLIFDIDSPFVDLEKSTSSIKKALPKKVYLLSLFPRAYQS